MDTELYQFVSQGNPPKEPVSTYLPFGIEAILNRLEQVLTDEIRVLARDLLRLFPDHTGLTLQRLPVELDELGGTIIRDKAERVDTEAINVSEGTRDTVTSHSPEQSVQRAGLLAEEVPGRVVRGSSLGDFIVPAGLDGMDQIGEEYSILDEEDGDVVSNEVYGGRLDSC